MARDEVLYGKVVEETEHEGMGGSQEGYCRRGLREAQGEALGNGCIDREECVRPSGALEAHRRARIWRKS